MRFIVYVVLCILLFSCGDTEEINPPPKVSVSNTIFEFDALDEVVLTIDVSSKNPVSSVDWQLTSGQSIEFTYDNRTLSFVAPVVGETTELVFSLTVIDNKGLKATEDIALKVYPPTTSLGEYSHLVTLDIDNDQLDDIIMSERTLLVWYKNQGGGVFTRKKVISDFSESITNFYISNNPETESSEIFISTANQYFYIDYQSSNFAEPISISSNWATDDSSICLGNDAILEDVTKDGISDVVWSSKCLAPPYYEMFEMVVFIAKGIGNSEYSQPEIVRSFIFGGMTFSESFNGFIIDDLNNDAFKDLVVYHGYTGAGGLNAYTLSQISFAQEEPKVNQLHSANFGFTTDENDDYVLYDPGSYYDGVYIPTLQFIDINNDSKLDILETGGVIRSYQPKERYQKILLRNGDEYVQNDYDSFPLLFNYIRDLDNDGNNDLILIGERSSSDDNLISVISWQESNGVAYDELTDIHLADELYKTVLIGNFDANGITDFLPVTSTGELKPILR